MNFKLLRELFLFTAKERNGLLILLFILFLVICGNYFLPYLLPEREYDTSSWAKEAERYYHTDITMKPSSASSTSESNSGFTDKAKNESFRPPAETSAFTGSYEGSFNPDNADLDVLLQIGVPSRLASNWIKYLEKGGKFYKKEDVMKLYGMNAAIYEKLKDHLILVDKKPDNRSFGVAEKSANKISSGYGFKDSSGRNVFKVRGEIMKVDINLGDSTQLEALPGIGPSLASRIIKYRKLLGGFYQVDQLKEIYGMNEEWWTKISPWLFLGNVNLNKLELNYLSLVELGRHPYIGFRTARKIIKLRDITGKFKSTDELAVIISIDSLQRLLPYLSAGAALE